MLLRNYAYWIQSGWNKPLAICQGQEEGNPTPPTPAEITVPFILTLPPKGCCLVISPNMPTIWIHCPWDALFGANAKEKVPYMSAIQGPCVLAIEACVSADKIPCMADNHTPCLSEIIAPCPSEIEATCLSKDKTLCVADIQTPCVSEIKAPCVSGNQASYWVLDDQVLCVSGKNCH